MSSQRPLRGRCQCGRNRYIIYLPQGANEVARVLFNSNPDHREFQASPLAAFLRVPLEWYRSATFAFFPDETNAMIRRVYTSPTEQHSIRHFCGFCGTPLSYWSEQPRTEADFIQLTLGSLSSEDLGDLEDLGLLPESDEEPGLSQAPATPADIRMTTHEATTSAADTGPFIAHLGRETRGSLPWFETLVEGSRLATIRTSRGSGHSRDGTVRVEWEVVEYTEDDNGDDSLRSGKRKFDERDDNKEGMQGVEEH